MNLKTILLLILLCWAALPGGANPPLNAAQSSTLNIVIILADDYGYGSAGCVVFTGAKFRVPQVRRTLQLLSAFA